ncbi:MAG: hypothetical protein Kow0099_06890 [Candidatus Abyssubacteria bacterium]
MGTSGRPRGFTILAIVLTLFALGTVAFWIEFFTTGSVAMSEQPCYLEHEQSFPAADGFMVVCSLLGAAGIMLRRSWGLLFGLLAGSAIIFLGLMDTLYSLQQNMFDELSPVAFEAAFINILCLTLGPATIVYLWRKRAYLLQPLLRGE